MANVLVDVKLVHPIFAFVKECDVFYYRASMILEGEEAFSIDQRTMIHTVVARR